MIQQTVETPPLDAKTKHRKESGVLRMQRATRRAADLLVDQLVQCGVEVVFGVPGGAIAPVYDALLDRSEIRVINNRHESHAVFSAAAYAQTSGKLGVVLVTSGPGFLNTINGIGSVQTDSLPVLVIAGEATRGNFGRGAIQEGSSYALNVVGVASHVAKLAFEVPTASAVPSMIRRAIATARSGRPGVVVASVPLDLLGSPVAVPTLAHETRTTFELDAATIGRVAAALEEAQRPVLFAGSGARAGNTPHLMRLLAERLGCAVMTTPRAKGVFPESHPQSLGVFGMGGHASARAHLEHGMDLLLVIGSSLNEVSTDAWSELLQPKGSLIQIDIDASRIGRAYAVDIGVCAPAEQALREILVELPVWNHDPVTFGLVRDHDPEQTLVGEQGRVTAPRALWELQRVLPSNAIFTGDSGTNLFYALHYLTLDRPDSFVTFLGLGSMGTSLAASLGAQTAQRDRPVVAVCGDGGFHMASAELSTASAYNLPVIVCVLNNGTYGMVELGNRAIYGRTPEYHLLPLDIPQLAAACGADCLVIEQPGQILEYGARVAARERPLVLDVRFDPTVRIPTNRRFETLDDALTAPKLN